MASLYLTGDGHWLQVELASLLNKGLVTHVMRDHARTTTHTWEALDQQRLPLRLGAWFLEAVDLDLTYVGSWLLAFARISKSRRPFLTHGHHPRMHFPSSRPLLVSCVLDIQVPLCDRPRCTMERTTTARPCHFRC
jgi:hypothetical protein